MGLLGTPKGIFKLDKSNKYVGSYISRQDIKTILSVSDADLKAVPFEMIDGIEYMDETRLRDFWKKGKITNAPPFEIGKSSISLDEYILVAIIKNTFPALKEENIAQQVKWGGRYIDIKLTINSREYFIEFHGPGHFKQLSIRPPEDPFQRKFRIEKDFGISYLIWPYWIQRCSRNLNILLNNTREIGYGALWSTKVHFGEFYFHNSYEIIKEITNQFNAAPNGNYGYFYDENGYGRNKPEHPIVKSILGGKIKDGINRLLPNGIDDSEVINWLPEKLKKYGS